MSSLMVLDFFEGYLPSLGTPTESASRRLTIKIKLIGTAMCEFDFLVLAKRFLKLLKYCTPYVPAGYFNVMWLKKILNCIEFVRIMALSIIRNKQGLT